MPHRYLSLLNGGGELIGWSVEVTVKLPGLPVVPKDEPIKAVSGIPGLGRVRSAECLDGSSGTASISNVVMLSIGFDCLSSIRDAREYVHHADHCNVCVKHAEVPRSSANRDPVIS